MKKFDCSTRGDMICVRAWRMRRTTPKKRCVRHLLHLSKVVGSVPTNEITMSDYINRLEMFLYRGGKGYHGGFLVVY